MVVSQINCSGTPYEIGLAHGLQASSQIRGSLAFYKDLFQTTTNLTWLQVRDRAAEYLPPLENAYPRYIAEMRGIADGVTQQQQRRTAAAAAAADKGEVDILDILALNVRSEVLFGLFTAAVAKEDDTEKEKKKNNNNNTNNGDDIPMDGCTSLGFVHEKGQTEEQTHTIIAQNWDWMLGSQANLIILHIHNQSESVTAEGGEGEGRYPDIVMVTEAGIIGKIGFNSAGVGICQNAIRARGVDVSEKRLPVHLAMRRVLECWSQKEAVEELKRCGVSGSVYLLVGGDVDDGNEGVVRVSGVECTSTGVQEMFMSVEPPESIRVEGKENMTAREGDVEMLVHANRLLLEHPGVEEPPWLVDSDARTIRLREVVNDLHRGRTTSQNDSKSFEYEIHELFEDEEGYPVSINRRQIEGKSTAETLFTIVMNLTQRKAWVSFGRPTESKDVVEVSFSGQAGKLEVQRAMQAGHTR